MRTSAPSRAEAIATARPVPAAPAGGAPRVLGRGGGGGEDGGALAGEGDRDRAADAAVAAGDDGALAGQPPGSAVALLAVVGLGVHLAQRPGRGLLLLGLGVRAG